jgi:cobalt-zinc-cadmium efflux system outer membrane protein
MPSLNGLNLTRCPWWLLRGCRCSILIVCIVAFEAGPPLFAQTRSEHLSHRRAFVTKAKSTAHKSVAVDQSGPPPAEPLPLPPIAQPALEAPASLSWFWQLAVENHPALNVASADVVAAKREALQASLRPNPQLGIFADEVGNDDSAGLIGVYLQRRIIRGGKLELAKQAKCLEAAVLTQTQRQQLQRIETDVKTEFYRLLVSQRRVELTSQLQDLQAESLKTAQLLYDAAETPKTDLLQTQVQSGRVELKLRQAKIAATAAWRRLATAVSFPDLPQCSVEGSLNEIVDPIGFEDTLETVLAASPEREEAVAAIDLARAQLRRQVAQAIPDYQTQLTFGQDTATDDFFTGFQLQVPLMVSDRNQGNIAAARARVARAESQLARVELLIARRLTGQFENYESASAQVEMYDSNLIPKARESLEIASIGYRAGEVDFLQVATAQQSLLALTLEYLDALEILWNARQQILGLTLSDPLTN